MTTTAPPPGEPGPDQPPRRFGWSRLPALLRLGPGLRLALAGLLMLELLSYATVLVQPQVVKWLLDSVSRGASFVPALLTLAAVALCSGVLIVTSSYQLGKLGQRMVLGARAGMIDALLRARVSTVQRRPIGDVLSRIGSDTTLLQHALSEALVRGAVAPVVLLATVVLMALSDLTMVLVLLAVVAVGAGVEWLILHRLAKATEAAQAGVGEMLTGLQRVLLAFRTVKAFGTEADEARAVVGQARLACRQGVRAAGWNAVVGGTGWVLMDIMFLTALGMGGARIASGAMSVSDLVAFLLYVTYLRTPSAALTQAASAMSEGLAALARIEQIQHIPAEPDDQDASAEPEPAPADDGVPAGIALDGVWAGYEDQPVLSGVSVHVPRGLTVVTGPSGIGKTTVLNVVERFLELRRGRVLLDGVDIRAFQRGELRRRLAYVEQDAPLLGATIREAVGYGAASPGETELLDVVHAVGLADWVASLPDGLDTAIGERAVAVSGGQRQRLAVARALLRHADVLLLDEATSQLDADSEETLLRTIAEQARVRIVLAVSHRMTVASQADLVIVLDESGVRAAGSHRELLRSDPLYRRLASTGGTR
ncbi:ABC transporter ATP-binding protein [Amycolatopsis rubida]|uniref:ABC transporter ATP-binding protein n=1 Tax=Amycolatopsis rubida TaxID=112413 RepID=A0A1I6AJ28_9PSEU|nr:MULTISPECIES: ABC transporter ATP-binding protein [Amycolatopsis]MYW90023.1 ATP-binding cassette domain-containing protein [Amycolatopsis rubida]NEC55000.1 ABC transporter ATP-binding protein [Amycolatopsis rubida]OAP20588.1 putative multidrug export ATP-binding/permease protein [Amycolatopsis sp. M39]SFQ68711.1 ATP-binding cassette, subfamily C [Amycolatopsis rubida]